MKNKSKLKKIRERKTMVPAVPAEWPYMNPEPISFRQIYELFGEGLDWKAEYWEEAGVLEIEIPESGSVDMEAMDADLGDEEGNAYLKRHGIQTVAAVTIVPGDYEKAKAVMKFIIEKAGGFFCGDTDTFQPEIGQR